MPQPPNEGRAPKREPQYTTRSLQDLSDMLRKEFEKIAIQHEEILSKLGDQQQALKERLAGIHENSKLENVIYESPHPETCDKLSPSVSKAAIWNTSGSNPTTGSVNGRRNSKASSKSSGEATSKTLAGKSKLHLAQRSLSFLQEGQSPSFMCFREFVTKGGRFELIVASLILANSVVLCCEVQYAGLDVGFDLRFPGCNDTSTAVWPHADSVFLFFDWVFGILFAFEMLIKLVCLGVIYFMQIWNYLDAVCVGAFIADKIASALLPLGSQTIRLLRLCRLVRLIRLMRYLESLDVLYVMTTAIAGMSRIVAWAVALLSLMLMMCALFLTQILHAYYFNEKTANNLPSEELKKYHALYEYFGSFTRCLLSMFELTLANWPPVARLLAEEVSEWFMLLSVIHKLTIGFAVVGVLNGVILQETFKVAATDDVVMLRQKQRMARLIRQKMLNLFEALDISGDGKLDFGEFLIIAANKEVNTWLASMDVETDDLRTLFNLLDTDKSGTISVEELVTRMPRIKGAARGIDMM